MTDVQDSLRIHVRTFSASGKRITRTRDEIEIWRWITWRRRSWLMRLLTREPLVGGRKLGRRA